jgi:putative radical SAM enzyme (TIGR03279 family)
MVIIPKKSGFVNMSVPIKNVIPDSPADRAGIKAGSRLVSIDGFPVNDVLDFMFYGDDDMGLEFDSFLMDEKRHCGNNCIFCFVDQNPPNMRETVYFKDDDSRLSFLHGNYITLTNLTESDIERIVQMRTPVNVSVHTTNPDLRVRLMGNPNAGKALDALYRFAEAGIPVNCQLVLCAGINDGEELVRSLNDLTKLKSVESTAVVPVGLTGHRKGLPQLRSFTQKEAAAVIKTVGDFADTYAADEFYLISGTEIPEYEHYGAFPQYENGVGMSACMKHGFLKRCAEGITPCKEKIGIVTGTAAFPLMEQLVKPFANVQVYPIRNDFFGESVTVSGLITGGDIIAQLRGKDLGGKLLIGASSLNCDGLFLDDTAPADIESALGVKVQVVEPDGESLFSALCSF